MADNTAPTTQEYNNTGFAEASGVSELKNQANQIKIDDASLRQQAEAQYKQTYDTQQQSLKNQLSALIQSQTDDSELLNRQYNQSINTMMSKLAKRGLNTGVTPGATTAALDKFRNEVMTQRQALYGVQQEGVRKASETLSDNYDLNIRARMATNRSNALASLNDLLAQIAKLQTSSYEDYIQYLLSKKDLGMKRANLDIDLLNLEGKKMQLEGDEMALEGDKIELENKKIQADKTYGHSGGGGSRRGSGGTGTVTPTTASSSNELGTSYFSGSELGTGLRILRTKEVTSGVLPKK